MDEIGRNEARYKTFGRLLQSRPEGLEVSEPPLPLDGRLWIWSQSNVFTGIAASPSPCPYCEDGML